MKNNENHRILSIAEYYDRIRHHNSITVSKGLYNGRFRKNGCQMFTIALGNYYLPDFYIYKYGII